MLGSRTFRVYLLARIRRERREARILAGGSSTLANVDSKDELLKQHQSRTSRFTL